MSSPIDLTEVGAFPSLSPTGELIVRFGVYLPGIDSGVYDVRVRVIHKDDRFDPAIQPKDFSLAAVAGHPTGLWQTSEPIPLVTNTHFGQPGIYLYRYQLWRRMPGNAPPQLVTRWFTDPFARATEIGDLAAFATPGFIPEFPWTDDDWKVPDLSDLVVYELHVEEFNDTFDGVAERLPYLKSLGVTCLELMPVTSLKLDFDWGYGPLHYFAPNERWGGSQGLKRLIDACHNAGVAVILDVVYQHTHEDFPYHRVYTDAGVPSPMIGGVGPFGPEIDYAQEFARAYVQEANRHWLTEYHVDGFRYDEVTDLYDGPTGQKYAKMAFDAYNLSLAIPRFTPSGGTKAGEYSRIIQCPEALNRPQEILRETYSNATWQDALLAKAEDMAIWGYVDVEFVRLLDLTRSGYPPTKTVHDTANQPIAMPVAPFQYLESHDKSALIAFVGAPPGNAVTADRSKYYKLQPFAIALYTCEGIPMLRQGQEFAENYILPPAGDLRIHFRRDVHWEHFYDDAGVALVRLYRRLAWLRHAVPALRSRQSHYDADTSRPGDGVVAYWRETTQPDQHALVLLNFSDGEQSVNVRFPSEGTYREMLDDDVRVTPFTITVNDDTPVTITVPSNYGYVFVA